MLRDNLAGLTEPMIDRAGAHAFGGHPKPGPTGGCSRSTELTIVVLKRSRHQDFRWKTGRQTEKAKRPGFEVITAAHDSRAVGTALHQSHRTIDPQCLKKSPPRRGGIYALTENVSSPFHAEPTQTVTTFPDREIAETLYVAWVTVLEASNQRPFCALPPPFADSFKLKSTSSTEQPLQPNISTILPKFARTNLELCLCR